MLQMGFLGRMGIYVVDSVPLIGAAFAGGASRANLAKAHAESRKPENYDRYHKHKLRHGLYAALYDKLLGQLADAIREKREKKRKGKGKSGESPIE